MVAEAEAGDISADPFSRFHSARMPTSTLRLPRLAAHYIHHGVGQGLFTSGVLQLEGRPDPIVWVHDCGSESAGGDNLIASGCALLNRLAGGRRRIDILAISHFDSDHISGIKQLLADYEVGTILLPYFPLWSRLVVAFSQPTDPALTNFCVDPVAFLSGLDGARFDRIVFVNPGANPSPEASALYKAPEKFDTDLAAPVTPIEQLAGPTDPVSYHPGVRVEVLHPGQSVSVWGVWEFLPYADPKHAPAPRTRFRQEVAKRLSTLRRADQDTHRVSALNELKSYFDRTFGRGAKARNRISLCLYAGPIETPEHVDRSALKLVEGKPESVAASASYERKAAQLLTGDAYLNTDAAIKRFTRHFGRTHRLRRICSFQVMHHGSRANHHPSVPTMVSPMWSVFSSDPGRKNPHPHAEVRRAYSAFGAMQVDSQTSFVITLDIVPSRSWYVRSDVSLIGA